MKRVLLIMTVCIYSLIKLGQSQSCNPAHNRELVGGVCVCKAGFYDSGAQNCPACNTICLTCVTTASTCTGCDATKFLTLSGTTCICMDGYVNILGVCTPCHYSCKTCSGLLSTNCITCNTLIRLLSSTSCLCLNGTYDNTTLQSCQPCNSKCLWCSASTANDCTKCDSNLLRAIGTSNPGPCICYDGYYDSTPALCQPCHYSCVTCSITSTTCLTCDTLTQFRSLSGTSCTCISHYYDSGTAVCSMCSPRCGNCSSSADICLTCNTTTRILTSTSCPCIDGYYEQSSTITCLACTSYCLTCVNSSSTCLSCYGYGNRLLYNATCSCITGYYDNGTIFCQSCPYYCLTCVGPDPPQCTSCPVSSHRTVNGSGVCACDNGYYDDGSSVGCLPCLYSCQTCSSSASLCTSCDATAHRTQIATDCQCSIGYYDDGINQVCASCHYSCVSCFGGTSSQCYTCQPNRDYTSYSCPCFIGMYQLSQLCYTCDPICYTCVNTSTLCTSCPISRALSNNTCICADGYYASGSYCPPCDTECSTCVGSSTTCLSCNPLHLTVLSGSSCVCSAGYYKNTTTLICMPCHYSCHTCLTSNLSTDCTSCNALQYRTLTLPSPNVCMCMGGYFDAGLTTCQQCHSHCTTCLGGATDYNCTACITGYVLIGSYCKYNLTCLNYLYDNQCLNTCPSSTYPSSSAVGNVCLPCTNACYLCMSSTYCLSCVTGTYYNATSHTCLYYCPIGHYVDNNNTCVTCPLQCTQCTYSSVNSTLVCQTCAAGYYKQDGGVCVAACASGYLLVGTMCHRCPSHCLTCTSLTINGCITCLTGYYMLSGVCYGVCPLGYMPSQLLMQCVICPSECSTCINNKCLSCQTGSYLNDQNKCTPLGYMSSADNNLIKCHPNCKSCTNTSFSSCLMCSSLRGDHAQMAISGYCQCKESSIDTGDGRCDTVAYEDVLKATEILKGATQASMFLTSVVAVLSHNFVPVLSFVNYLQSYSIMYFLNSSAVMQTDIVLGSYYYINPIYYYRMQSQYANINESNKRLLVTMQSDQSLFFRSKSWQYLSDWAFPALAINLIIWAIPVGLSFCLCCCFRQNKVNNTFNTNDNPITKDRSNQNMKNNTNANIITNHDINQNENLVEREQNNQQNNLVPSNRVCKFFTKCLKYPFAFYIKQFLIKYNQSVAILFYMITYSEVALYAIFSFKNMFKMETNANPFTTHLLDFILSIIIALYYVLYLLRLMIGCAKAKIEQTQTKDLSPLRILFHFYRKNATKKLNKMFLSLLMLRNICISVCIVMLSFNPLLQSATSLGLIVLFMLFSFCCCPYPGTMRVFLHLSDFFFVLQIGLLTYTTWLPQQSRIEASKVLIVLNFFQIALAVAICLWIILTLTNQNICKKKKNNKVAVENKLTTQKHIQKEIRNEDSISNLNEHKDQDHKAVMFEMEDIQDHITKEPPQKTPPLSDQTQKFTEDPRRIVQPKQPFRSATILTKKYRIKRKV